MWLSNFFNRPIHRREASRHLLPLIQSCIHKSPYTHANTPVTSRSVPSQQPDSRILIGCLRWEIPVMSAGCNASSAARPHVGARTSHVTTLAQRNVLRAREEMEYRPQMLVVPRKLYLKAVHVVPERHAALSAIRLQHLRLLKTVPLHIVRVHLQHQQHSSFPKEAGPRLILQACLLEA